MSCYYYSETFTGIEIKKPCGACGRSILHSEKSNSHDSRYFYYPKPHKAKCGLLCIAGGVSIKEERTAKGAHGINRKCPKCGIVDWYANGNQL